MADNYLEKRYEEVFSGKDKSLKNHKKTSSHPSLNSLLLKNRSYRGYDPSREVLLEELKEIVNVNNKIPSAKNQQVLRFHLITKNNGSTQMLPLIKFGAALPQLHLPLEGAQPEAFIIICSTVPENKWVDIDLGISAQSMLLKAVEMGLNGICIGAFNKEEVSNTFSLRYDPVMILAIGKGNEKIQILDISPEDNHNYYRENGIHFVPKVNPDDLII